MDEKNLFVIEEVFLDDQLFTRNDKQGGCFCGWGCGYTTRSKDFSFKQIFSWIFE